MKAKTGQRLWYKGKDGEAIIQVIDTRSKLLKVKIIKVFKTKTYGFEEGVEAMLEFYTKDLIGNDEFKGKGTTGDLIHFKYLKGQEKPKKGFAK